MDGNWKEETMQINLSNDRKCRIFICYSRTADSRWFKEGSLIPYLVESMRKQADFWYDREGLNAGDIYRHEIELQIDKADLAILLISQEFFNSEFIETVELPRILARTEAGAMEVLPILTQPCSWEKVPQIERYQMVPGQPTPLIDFTTNDARFINARYEILKALEVRINRILERKNTSAENGIISDSSMPGIGKGDYLNPEVQVAGKDLISPESPVRDICKDVEAALVSMNYSCVSQGTNCNPGIIGRTVYSIRYMDYAYHPSNSSRNVFLAEIAWQDVLKRFKGDDIPILCDMLEQAPAHDYCSFLAAVKPEQWPRAQDPSGERNRLNQAYAEATMQDHAKILDLLYYSITGNGTIRHPNRVMASVLPYCVASNNAVASRACRVLRVLNVPAASKFSEIMSLVKETNGNVLCITHEAVYHAPMAEKDTIRLQMLQRCTESLTIILEQYEPPQVLQIFLSCMNELANTLVFQETKEQALQILLQLLCAPMNAKNSWVSKNLVKEIEGLVRDRSRQHASAVLLGLLRKPLKKDICGKIAPIVDILADWEESEAIPVLREKFCQLRTTQEPTLRNWQDSDTSLAVKSIIRFLSKLVGPPFIQDLAHILLEEQAPVRIICILSEIEENPLIVGEPAIKQSVKYIHETSGDSTVRSWTTKFLSKS